MIENFRNTSRDLVQELGRHKLQMTSTAMAPLRKINFSRLVRVYDHEEAFLRQMFMESLLEAHRARIRDSGKKGKINAQDVRAAMLMLGAKVSAANEAQFSSASKSIVRDVCPYCQ